MQFTGQDKRTGYLRNEIFLYPAVEMSEKRAILSYNTHLNTAANTGKQRRQRAVLFIAALAPEEALLLAIVVVLVVLVIVW